jgi:hypothetical protein
MAVKVIFSECSIPFWIDVADNLVRQHQWKPIYWTARPDYKTIVTNRFPDIVFHSNIDAVRGIPAPDCMNLPLPPIDQPLLKELSFNQSIALRMMNRMDRTDSFSFEEREHLYHQYVRYWNGVITHYSPDVVVFSVSPHLIYDYILYSLCKKYNIVTILFEQTSLDGWVYPEQHFEEGSHLLQTTYKSMVQCWKLAKNKKFMLSDEADAHLKKISNDYSVAVPFYMKDQFAQKNITRYLIKKILANPENISNMIKKGRYLFSRGHYIKAKGSHIEDSNMRGMRYIFCKVEGIKKKNKLKQRYNIIEQPADFQKPYIYYPLHYQPENTTSPLGESYADQFLVIDMLSKFAPKDWKIYVKEHSSQWHIKLRGESGRPSDFYDKVSALPNVQLIPLSTSNFDLIDHAKAVVTITGTAGWEAAVRGKPVLIFGHAWYKFCEGVFYVSSKEDCKNAFLKIQSGYIVDKELVRLFLSAIQQIGVKAFIEPAYEKILNIPYEKNVSILTSTIHGFYSQIPSKKN